MISISGYQTTEKIYESNNSLVFRAHGAKKDATRVTFKIFKENFGAPGGRARYRHEFEILQSLDIPGVIKAHSIQNYRNSLMLIMEDFGGDSMEIWSKRSQPSLIKTLDLAIRLTDILGQIHERDIIHKDLNPSNIVYNPKTDTLKIIDFGISTRLSRENPVIENPDRLEGTLAYMSPEQTGRMNRVIDYRTDYYSLGCVFYWMLTGSPPFSSPDSMELIHAHLAKPPHPLHQVDPTIPEPVSNVVMKLLEKNAEDRYQSTFGLRSDLEHCLSQIREKGMVTAFPIGREDFSDKFRIPQKLYGREREVSILLKTFERVSGGARELIMVSGYSGIGKSAIVREVHTSLVRRRGFFYLWKIRSTRSGHALLGLCPGIAGIGSSGPDRIGIEARDQEKKRF